MEATGVEPTPLLQTRKLLTLKTDRKDKNGYISDYCIQNAYKRSRACRWPQFCKASQQVNIKDKQPPRPFIDTHPSWPFSLSREPLTLRLP